MEAKAHWEQVYQTKRPDEVSWYRSHLDISLELVQDAAPARDSQIIDVGGGESTLVDDLLALNYTNVHVLDLSPTALAVTRDRLGRLSSHAKWLTGDVTSFPFSRHQFDVWHDRAVFHFLTAGEDRANYVAQVARAVKPGGHVVVATFGPEGPQQCSGLNVMRYEADGLHAEFGAAFRLVRHLTELHETPRGAIQQFTYCYCSVSSDAP
ncbi:MAG: class I SAM-dependent methyltransferase [Betaproteobacteria bacterium]